MPKAVIIGATSGIGRSLAHVLSENGYVIGVTGRRTELLKSLKEEISGSVFIKTMDLTNPENARHLLQELYDEMEGFDLIILNAGVGSRNKHYEWKPEAYTINVNVVGFVALANLSYQLFKKQGHGHIAGVSSIAAHLSDGRSTSYSASKTFMSNYLKGLDYKSHWDQDNIDITCIEPGFIDTPMVKGQRGMFWIISADKAAQLIFKAMRKKKRHVYVPGRWRIIVWLFHLIPDSLFRQAGRLSRKFR